MIYKLHLIYNLQYYIQLFIFFNNKIILLIYLYCDNNLFELLSHWIYYYYIKILIFQLEINKKKVKDE